MIWLLYAFAAPFLWAISIHIDKYLVDRYFHRGGVAALVILTGVMGLLLAGSIGLAAPAAIGLPVRDVLLIMASGALSMLAMYFYFVALQGEEASVVVPWFQFSPLFAYGLAYLILGETLTLRQIIGGATIVVAAIAMSLGGASGQRFKARLALLMLTCAFVVAVSTVIFKLFAIQDAFWPTTAWTGVGQAAFCLLLLARGATRQDLVAMFRGRPVTLAIINAVNEVVNLGGLLAQRWALVLAPLSLVQAIGGTGSLFVFLIGIGLTLIKPSPDQEDLSPPNLARKAAAAVLVLLGVCLISV